MISIEAFYIIIPSLILLFAGGLFCVYHEQVLGFVASGFAMVVTVAFTVLAGFGRVGNVQTFLNSTDELITNITLIDSSMVYVSAFIALVMGVIFLVVLGRYIAALAMQHNTESEETENETWE